jgi:tetratricopeptide (TPR) repeat protein
MSNILDELENLNARVIQLAGEENIEEAVNVAQQAVQLGIIHQQTENEVYANSVNNLAELYRLQERFAQAQPLYTQALNLRRRLFGNEHPDVAQSLNNLGAFYLVIGNYSEAKNNFEAALNIWEKLVGSEHPQVAITLNNIAEVCREQGLYLEAENIYKQVLIIQNMWLEQYPSNVW